MGFSVSGSFAIIAVGTFIAVGVFYGAASNGAELVTESQSDAFDNRLEQQNTAINITRAEYDTSLVTDTLIIEVKNTGSTALEVNDTDYIVDNELITHEDVRDQGSESVDGDSDTQLWLPGETLRIEITSTIFEDITNPDRVRIVTGPGVADSKGVTVI